MTRSEREARPGKSLDLLAIGRAGIDLYSLDYGAPLEKVTRFAKYVGGTTANIVVGAARLGLSCALITRVGDDEHGRFIKDYLEAEGVDASRVELDPRRKTGIVFSEVTPGKDSKFIFYRENAGDLFLRKSDVPSSLLSSASLVLLTGTGLSREPSLGSTVHVAKETKRLGGRLVFNLDWRPPLWSVPERVRVARYATVIEGADIIVGNDGEYRAATGEADVDSALDSIPALASKLAVVTQGARGSLVVFKGRRQFVPGFEVKLLKGLGGGDGFLSGFLFGILRGWDAARSAAFGNACGAIVVTGHACSESMPRLPEVTRFLKQRGYGFSRGAGPSKP